MGEMSVKHGQTNNFILYLYVFCGRMQFFSEIVKIFIVKIYGMC